jgi:hypothetical protein
MINATFRADFSSFIDACDKAEIALVDMSKGASKVESSLNKMVDSFSGRKLIQDAVLMERAIENVGGVTKLTAKELETAGPKAAEAAEKMRRMGMDVPPGLQKIADTTKVSTDRFQGMKSMVTDVAAGLAAMFTIRAATGLVKDVVNTASALQDLSNQTHVDVEEIQILAGAMSEFGVDAETLAKVCSG